MFFNPLAFSILIALEIGATVQTNGAFPVAPPHTVQSGRGEIGGALTRLLEGLGAGLLGGSRD
jgi:hypothetical protein